MRPVVTLTAVGERIVQNDLEAHLRSILADLCQWLDDLETLLVETTLVDCRKDLPAEWVWNRAALKWPIPSGRRLVESARGRSYMYLPVCQGEEASP
jgi:hypothetical protein